MCLYRSCHLESNIQNSGYLSDVSHYRHKRNFPITNALERKTDGAWWNEVWKVTKDIETRNFLAPITNTSIFSSPVILFAVNPMWKVLTKKRKVFLHSPEFELNWIESQKGVKNYMRWKEKRGQIFILDRYPYFFSNSEAVAYAKLPHSEDHKRSAPVFIRHFLMKNDKFELSHNPLTAIGQNQSGWKTANTICFMLS